MKILTIVSFVFLVLTTDPLVQNIKEAKLKINLPNAEWFLADRIDKGNLVVYQYKRSPIEDDEQRKIIPNIAVIVEEIDKKTDVMAYSLMKRLKTPFEVDEVFIHDSGRIDFKNAIAYRGHYTDGEGMEHTIYIVHAISNKKGIQVIMDTTSNILDQVDSEFLSALKSIRE